MRPAALPPRFHLKFMTQLPGFFLFCFLCFGFAVPAAAAGGSWQVTDFGATGDGTTPDTASFQRTIDRAAASDDRRVVEVPRGDYLIGTVYLRSGITLRLAEGARIIGTRDLSHYPLVEDPQLPWGDRWERALIYGRDVENVVIEGGGTIDGNRVRDPQGEAGQRGPHTVSFRNAANIVLRSVSITDSGNYASLFLDCKNCLFEDLTITGGWDGIHVRETEKIHIRRCRLATGDDAIAGHTWTDAIVEDCEINSSCNGLRLFAAIRDLRVSRCRFTGPGQHPHLGRGGTRRTNMLAGVILQPGAWNQDPTQSSNITLEDLVMENLMTPVHCSLREGNSLDGFHVRNLRATGIYGPASSVESWGETITDSSWTKISVDCSPPADAPPVRDDWRKAGNGVRLLPVWAFYARNVDGLVLQEASWRSSHPIPAPPADFVAVRHLRLIEATANGDDLRSP